MTKEWFKAQEAADVLNTSRQSIAKMVEDGQFKRIKWVGNQVRIHYTELHLDVPQEDRILPDVGVYISEIRRRLDELEARLLAS